MENRAQFKPGDFSLGQTHEFVGAFGRRGGSPQMLQQATEDAGLMERLVAFWQSGALVSEDPTLVPAPTPAASLVLTEPEKTAVRILGEQRVITAAQYARAWGIELPSSAVLLTYTEADLAKAAEMNKASAADWRLVYLRGLSLRSQHQLVGMNPRRQPCFRKDWSWWLNAEEDGWATQSLTPGYYLLDITGRFNYTSWSDQDKKIAKLGTKLAIDLSRAPEQAVAEAIFTTFKVTGERLLKDCCHWGASRSSNSNRVFVGNFGHGGLDVHDGGPDCAVYGVLQVVPLWKFRD